MEYDFEAEEIIEEPETYLGLPEMVRLKVKDEKEAHALAVQYDKILPANKFRMNLHTHDHQTGKSCHLADLRQLEKETEPERGL